MVTIYHYDENTGTYIGQNVAPGNPGDPDNPLIPAHSTTTPPPAGRVRYDAERKDWVSLEAPEPVKVEAPEPVKVEAPEPVKVEAPEPVKVEAKAVAPKKRSRKSRRK